MITQFFGEEKYSKVIKTGGTSLQLSAGTKVRVGGYGVSTKSALNCNLATNGLGGLDVGSLSNYNLYYIYLVISGSSFGLVSSLASSAPTGFLAYKKVGAFCTGGSAQITDTINFGSPSRNLSCTIGLTTDYHVATAVNDFLPLDNIVSDDSDLHNGSNGINIPEDGDYAISTMMLIHNLGSEIHTTKIYSSNDFAIGIHTTTVPIAGGRFSHPVPVIEKFLLKGDLIRVNVDSTSDNSYDVLAGSNSNSSYLSLSKKGNTNDIDWT